jgi:hypothetical protein
MSPIGGVGINLAIQDAVAASDGATEDFRAIKSNRVNDKNVKGFLTSAPSTYGRYFVSAVLLR